MFLNLWADGSVVNEGAARNRAAIDRNRRVYEVPVVVLVAHAKLRDLAWSATDWILMALHACRGIEYGAKPKARVLSSFKYLLIAGKSVSRRFGNAIAGAL